MRIFLLPTSEKSLYLIWENGLRKWFEKMVWENGLRKWFEKMVWEINCKSWNQNEIDKLNTEIFEKLVWKIFGINFVNYSQTQKHPTKYLKNIWQFWSTRPRRGRNSGPLGRRRTVSTLSIFTRGHENIFSYPPVKKVCIWFENLVWEFGLRIWFEKYIDKVETKMKLTN
jgi:hypothetical protein